MKRFFSLILTVLALHALVFAQCPDGSITTPGFHPPADQLPPIERGTLYNETVQVNIPASFDTTVPLLGLVTVTINNIHVDSINGTPANIVHACSPSNCIISGGGAGCITFSGTTNDPAGQYPLDIIVTATVTVPILGQQVQTLNIASLGFTYYLTVIEPGVLAVTASANPASICPGESSTLTASVTNGSGSETFLWSDGSTTNPTTVSPSATTPYSVTVTDGANTATASTTVTFNPTPTVAITPTTVSICNGASATLTASGGGTYSWSTGDATAAVTVSPTSTETYTVTVTTGGCTATASQSVTVDPTPAPVASFKDSTTDATVIFTNTSTNAASYSWDFDDGSTGTDPNPVHTYAANGTYTVTLTATDSCGSDTYSADVTIVGVFIKSIDNALKFSVYPNPSEGVFTIALSDNSGKQNVIKIYDLSGKNVFEETVSGTVQKQLDLSALPKGIYTLHLSSDKSNGVQKLVIR